MLLGAAVDLINAAEEVYYQVSPVQNHSLVVTATFPSSNKDICALTCSSHDLDCVGFVFSSLICYLYDQHCPLLTETTTGMLIYVKSSLTQCEYGTLLARGI